MKTAPLVKHPYKGGRKFALMAIDDIESGDRPGYVYLRRWRIFQCPLFAIYLHQIWEADTQGGKVVLPHNHPANFKILILKGGYEECVYPEPAKQPKRFYQSIRAQGSWRRMGTNEAHYIKELLRVPTWTLVFVGKRLPTWYFFQENGVRIDWKDYERHAVKEV